MNEIHPALAVGTAVLITVAVIKLLPLAMVIGISYLLLKEKHNGVMDTTRDTIPKQESKSTH